MGKICFDNAGFGTKAIHAGQEPEKLYGALATPIYQTSTFCFETVEQGMSVFKGETPGFAYSCTVDVSGIAFFVQKIQEAQER